MKREEIIKHLSDVAAAVFSAEDKIRPNWEERLQQMRDVDEDVKYQLYREYLRAVAEELVSAMPEDTLLALYVGDEEHIVQTTQK